MTDDPITIPIDLVVPRLVRNLREQDRLLGLLREVVAHHQLTNRLGEAIILLPEQVLADIREAIGLP